MFEVDDVHGYNKTRRLAAYDWCGRWLKGARDTVPEPKIEMATPEELRCTPTGQVSTSLGGESVLDRKSTRLNSSHGYISYAVFCLKKKKIKKTYFVSLSASILAPRSSNDHVQAAHIAS